MGNTRTIRRRLGTRRSKQRRDDWTGFVPARHTMWTVEGQIEQAGRFARSLNNARGWRRPVGKLLFGIPLWILLGGGVLRVLAWVWSLL